MNSIVTALKQMESEAGKSGRWKLEELCKMAALEIDEQAATIARLTAAHEMQGESLVVLPRWMVSNMEDKMKTQAAEIERLTEKVRYAYVQIEALERAK